MLHGLNIELQKDITRTVKSLGMWGEGRREDIIKSAKKKDKTPQEYLIEALEKKAGRYTGHFLVFDVPVLRFPYGERLSTKEKFIRILGLPFSEYKEFFQNSLTSEQRFVPFFKLPFINYEEATLDLEEPGQMRGIMHNDFSTYRPHIHYKENMAVANVIRPGLVGKLIN